MSENYQRPAPEEIWMLDKKYAEEGIPFCERPSRAVMDLIAPGFDAGWGVPSDSVVDSIERLYKKLVPEVGGAWPREGIGIAASVDQVRKMVVPAVYGEFRPASAEALGFDSGKDWIFWCRKDEAIAAESEYSFIDLYDFTRGINSIGLQSHSMAQNLWRQAASNIEVITDSLVNCYRTNSILQPICILAELSMKGALLKLGVKNEDLRLKFGHKLLELARELSRLVPHHEDELLIGVCASFPDYVKSRYDESALNRLQIVKLALKAQFVAASSLRRVSGADETLAVYASEWPGPRAM